MHNYYVWAGLFAALLAGLQAVDAYTTWRVLRLGGSEANPLVRWLMDRCGVGLALVLTKGGAAIVGVLLAWLAPRPWGLVALVLLCVLYSVVADSNFEALARRRAMGRPS